MKKPPDLPEPVGAVCPYCEQTLDKRPKRKKKCAHCGEYIFVRSRQHLFPSTLLTERDAIVVDHFEQLKGTASFGVDNEDFLRERETLTQRFGRQPASGDVLWSLYNRLAHDLAATGDRAPPFLYFLMAHFLYEDGRDFFPVLQQSGRMELMQQEQYGFVDEVRILTAGDASCEACQKFEGRVLTLHDALAQMPIPCKECSFELCEGKPGWCRCTYLPVVDV
jgi:hypothetical protein